MLSNLLTIGIVSVLMYLKIKYRVILKISQGLDFLFR